jgi:curved DNA-binding protein CbpA
MITSHRAGEITFYEELGVAPAASPAELREAFRTLVRLLHPDQQTDPHLKDAAEKQMRKLNRIYAVLSDPDRRRRYDQSLAGGYRPPIIIAGPVPNPTHRWGAGRITWAALLFFVAGLLIWFTKDNITGALRSFDQTSFDQSSLDQSSDTAWNSAPAPDVSDVTVDDVSRIAQLQGDLRTVTLERDEALSELDRLRGNDSAGATIGSEPLTAPADRSSPVAIADLPLATRATMLISAPPVRVDRPALRPMSGFWYYSRPSRGQHNTNRSLYLPEFIEATISDENGVIHGKYRARFQTADRAISPDVDFSFSGPSGTATYPWIGAAGAKGELTLKLVSENSLRVDWTTTDLGTQQGLASGTAVLTRRVQ